MPINKSTIHQAKWLFQWLTLSNHIGSRIQTGKGNGNHNIGDRDTAGGKNCSA